MEPGINGVTRNMNRLTASFPNQTKKFMKGEAKVLRKRMVSLAKSRVKKVTGNYLKGFKAGKNVYEWSDAEYNIRDYNNAPHAHLIEYGHRAIFWGRSTGWVPGKHIMEDALNNYEEEFSNHVENDLADFIVRELER